MRSNVNAVCPVCGERFHLHYHRGNGMFFQEHPCPNCGVWHFEIMYFHAYEAYEYNRKQSVGHAEKRPPILQEQISNRVDERQRERGPNWLEEQTRKHDEEVRRLNDHKPDGPIAGQKRINYPSRCPKHIGGKDEPRAGMRLCKSPLISQAQENNAAFSLSEL
jgi:hypothetical protein